MKPFFFLEGFNFFEAFVFWGVCFFVFLNSLCFLNSLFRGEPFVLNSLFLKPFFELSLFFEPFVLGGFDLFLFANPHYFRFLIFIFLTFFIPLYRLRYSELIFLKKE
ncbi:hypothetical protein DD780_04425 [Helicobacter pylori]|nr:hypothetical protein DD780_04425 [Helicobacter pylori]